MKTHLKFQALSLEAQARIVKRMLKGNRLPHPSLHQEFMKGRDKIRREARAINIVRGFLRGKSMTDIELPHRSYHEGHISCKNMTKQSPDWKLIEELLMENGGTYFSSKQEMLQRFSEFRDGASIVACAA